MLLDVIKKFHKKLIFSFYGVLTIVNLLLPIAILVIGIVMIATGGKLLNAVLIIGLSVIFMLYTYKRITPFFLNFKYIFHPEEFPLVKRLKEEGVDINQFDDEIKNFDILNSLNKDNPFILTDNLVFGFSQVLFFIMLKDELLWAYEYNGNGLVLFNNKSEYGYVQYKTVDGNDEAIAKLEDECPYLYFGLDFDYRKVMHDELASTIELVKNRIIEFKSDPVNYKEKFLEQQRQAKEEEIKRIEEEKNQKLKAIEEKEKELNIDVKEENDNDNEKVGQE